MESKKFTDWISLILGIWLIVSPWALMSSVTPAAGILFILGIGVTLVSIWALSQPELSFPEWWNVALGVILFIVPWIFNFYRIDALAWNAWIVGVVVLVLGFVGMPLGTHLRHHPRS